MAVKKPAGRKGPVRAKKPVAPATNVRPVATVKNVWALPVALLLLIVAASGLWLAVRDSSSQTQAAAPAATSAVMAPVREARTPPAAPAAMPATSGPSSHAATPPVEAVKPVSITGCLKRDGDGFVLKSTDGADAPKSRSWKSGFLKRSSSSVSLTDGPNASRLADHVGERVSVTGPLADRAMRVQSMRRVAATCE